MIHLCCVLLCITIITISHHYTCSFSGWWYTYLSEKYESQLGWWHSQYVNKYFPNVPNHQPVSWSFIVDLPIKKLWFFQPVNGVHSITRGLITIKSPLISPLNHQPGVLLFIIRLYQQSPLPSAQGPGLLCFFARSSKNTWRLKWDPFLEPSREQFCEFCSSRVYNL